MGTGIIKNLLKHDNEVTVYNRTKAHAQKALDAGASWADSPAAVIEKTDIVMSMVGFLADVEQIYYGENGIFSKNRKGQLLIDLTTSKPSLAKKLHASAKEKGADMLDSPVSGGDVGAKNGTLTIMVGGDQEVVDENL